MVVKLLKGNFLISPLKEVAITLDPMDDMVDLYTLSKDSAS
jgi:hypothetical protein